MVLGLLAVAAVFLHAKVKFVPETTETIGTKVIFWGVDPPSEVSLASYLTLPGVAGGGLFPARANHLRLWVYCE